MSIGVMIRQNPAASNDVDDVISQARSAFAKGVGSVWFGQPFDLDAITLSAVVAAAVPGLHVGTAAVPINPRHPLLVSSAAQTAQAAAHGNFSLGLGLGGHEVERGAFGVQYINVVSRLREYLTVLRAIFEDGAVDFDGEHVSAHPPATGLFAAAVAGGTPIPIYAAAMGQRALAVAGELADGTITYLAAPEVIAEFIKPTIAEAARRAGRPEPRVFAMVPVSVTDEPDAAWAAAKSELSVYDRVPSYRKVLDRAGLASAVNLAVIGDTHTVAAKLDRYRSAGATDLILNPFQTDLAVLESIWRLAATLARNSL